MKTKQDETRDDEEIGDEEEDDTGAAVHDAHDDEEDSLSKADENTNAPFPGVEPTRLTGVDTLEENQETPPNTSCETRSLRTNKPRNYDHRYNPDHFDTILAHFTEPLGELFMTEQMLLKRGLKTFGKAGADAVIAEMQQLDYRNVIKPTDSRKLTREQKKAALQYLM
jgi:hypothetical protein